VDGLLHITDMAWKRVKHPSEIVNVGDEVTVKVLKFDKDRTRVSLGLKQLGQDPWVAIAENHPVNSKLTGKVTNLTDYGCFVEILDGVEGLVHVSEMDWTNKNIHPSKVVSLGDTVEVMVLEVDEERRRISLGLKQCKPNPWTQFAETHNKGDKVTGKIKSITDFGIFIGLEGGIDGLVHLSDISWNVAGEEAVRNYKKGDEVSAVVLAVDAVKERISLGIKQLEDDPFNNFVAVNKKGAVISATVVEADAKGAKVELAGGVEGYIRAADLTNEVAVGDVVEAKYTGVDRKARIVHLSVKAKDQAEEAAAVANVNNKQEDVAIPNAMAEAFKAAKGE
ncbi:MAG: S1 RNA-binding domain-containing protein, partial [Haemophilus parainfluenzae]|nr:S1 RNA-binding domain-containing protein [Haemophilus parainfluenzae]